MWKKGRGSKMNMQMLEQQARELAQANKQAEPAIEKIYWFPNDKEIRLVELEKEMMRALSGKVEPFYFKFTPRVGLPISSGIAIIQTDEFGKLKLPRGWGTWEKAVELKVQP
jgi:hypothetical protein